MTQRAPRPRGWIWLPGPDPVLTLPSSPRTPGFWPRRSPTAGGPLPRMEHGLGPLLHHLRTRRDHPGVQPEPLLQTGDPAPPVPVRALPTCQGPRPPPQCLLEPGPARSLGHRPPSSSIWALEDKNGHSSPGPLDPEIDVVVPALVLIPLTPRLGEGGRPVSGVLWSTPSLHTAFPRGTWASLSGEGATISA